MDVRTTNGLLAAGAIGSFLGTSLLRWVSYNLFFTDVGATAWRVGGIWPLAGLLALGLLACAGAVLFADAVPVRVPPEATLAIAGLLALLGLARVLGGNPGAGAFVTVVSAGAAAFAANTLRTRAASPRAAGPGRPPAAASSAPGSFCPSCGAKRDESTAFCGQCGAKLR